MRHMLGNLSPNYFERTKRYMMLRASQQGTDLTVSGTPPLSLPNSLGKPLKAWEVALSPKQDLHGYSNPWPAGGGANKWDEEWEHGAYGSSGQKTDSTTAIRNVNPIPVVAGDTYYIVKPSDTGNIRTVFRNANNENVGYTNSATPTRTAPEGAVTLDFCIMDYGETYENNVSVNNPSTVTTYAPYSNICPIHGTDKLTITTAGKNLLDSSGTTSTTLYGVTFTPNSDGTITVNGTANQNITYPLIPSQGIDFPNGTYVISGCPTGGGSTTYRLRTDSQNGGSRGNDTGSGATFTVDDGRLYITYITIWNGATVNNLVFHPQICLASAPNPTEYTPYLAPSQTVLTLPQTVYTGTIGSEGGESRTAKKILTGAETITVTDLGMSTMMFVVPANDAIRRSDVTIPIRCSHYKYVHWNQAPWNVDLSASYYQTNYVRIKDNRFATIEEFKTYLSDQYTNETPVEIEYQIITPTTFAVPSVTIPTPTGTATTWATAEDGTVDGMEVTYVGKA